MNTRLIEQHWDGIGTEQQRAVVENFYRRLFDRHPRFRPFFPDSLEHQMEKMVQTLALVAKESDAQSLIHPHLLHVGARHRPYALTPKDLDDFVTVLIEVLGEYNVSAWSTACESSWREALYEVVLPFMNEGIRETAHGARKRVGT